MSSDKSPRDILPWLVNGSLDEAEHKTVQAAVETSPELQRERDFLAALRDSVKQQQPQAPLELGWQRLRRELRQELRRERRRGVSKNWRLAAVAASLVLIVQSVVVWLPDDNGVRYQPLSSSAPQHSLQVRFTDSATQASIQRLLRQQHLRIIDGPSAAGFYRLVGEGDPAKILATLQQQPGLVAYVQAE